MAWLSTLKGHEKAEDMIAYYALWIGSIKLSELSGWHDLMISLCFHMETMLNQSVYICRPLTAKPPRKPKESLQSPKWGEVRTTVEYFFDEIKTYNFFDFTSQLKIGLRSVERIYLIYGILENAKACLLLLSRDENLWNIE